MPRAGATSFGLYLSGAPPSSHGVCLVSRRPSSTGVTYFNTTLFLDTSSIVQRLPIVTSDTGYAEIALPLPVGTSGKSFSAQFVVRNPTSCTLGPVASSNALNLTVQ